MKSSALLATFPFILFLKFTDGQQNGLVGNFENINHVSKPIPDNFQRFWNQNGNAGPLLSGINQHQTTKTNTPLLSPSLQQIQLPPDLQPQPLQVQQHLQLQKSLPLEFQLQKQPTLQYQQSLKSMPQNQIDLTVQSQKELQLQTQTGAQLRNILQPQLPAQPVLQAQPKLHQQQVLQPQQTLQIPLQTKHPLPSPPQVRLQESVNFPQPLIPSDSIHLVDPVAHHNINYNPDSQIPAKWKLTNSHNTINVDNPSDMQILKIQPQQNYVIQPTELISTKKFCDKNQEVTSLGYVLPPQQIISPSILSASVPVVSNGHSITILSQEGIKPVISVPVSPSILTVPSPSIHTTNTQTYYPQPSNPGQNAYIGKNTGTAHPVTSFQSLPTASVPSQSSILSSIPYAALQVPSSPYAFANVAYTSNKSETTNLKSLLPLILNLLRERIASCECRNGCPCECKNKNSKNELEVLSGYSNQKHYGALDGDLSVMNPLSEESEDTKCPRERKNCDKIIEEGEDSQEEEDSDEDEVDEEEADEDLEKTNNCDNLR